MMLRGWLCAVRVVEMMRAHSQDARWSMHSKNIHGRTTGVVVCACVCVWCVCLHGVAQSIVSMSAGGLRRLVKTQQVIYTPADRNCVSLRDVVVVSLALPYDTIYMLYTYTYTAKWYGVSE